VRSLATLPRRLPHIVWFMLVFVRELVVANARVAWEIVTPGLRLEPGIVRVPTDCRTDLETMLLANTITMTPGTLSLEVDTDTRDLYVHSLYVQDREAFIADIHALERVLLKAMR
jgi:multicomponent Na+:H+ antiporter subunit E